MIFTTTSLQATLTALSLSSAMITEALAAYQQQLQTYANLLEQQDWQGLSNAFARAKATRDALLP